MRIIKNAMSNSSVAFQGAVGLLAPFGSLTRPKRRSGALQSGFLRSSKGDAYLLESEVLCLFVSRGARVESTREEEGRVVGRILSDRRAGRGGDERRRRRQTKPEGEGAFYMTRSGRDGVGGPKRDGREERPGGGDRLDVRGDLVRLDALVGDVVLGVGQRRSEPSSDARVARAGHAQRR